MSAQKDDSITSRRGFLRAAAATAVVATAAGGGVALVAEQVANNQAASAPIVAVGPAITTSQSGPVTPVAIQPNFSSSDMVKQLAETQAENIRLQTELANAQNRIAALEGSLGDNTDASAQMRMDLDAANSRNGVLAGLIALYDQIDDINLGDKIADGLSDVGTAVSDLIDDVPTLSESLEAGRTALSQFETEVPIIDAGRGWLLAHIGRMQAVYLAVETVLLNAVDNAAPFLEMLADWFEKVISWLPFGLGSKTQDVMAAMIDLFAETPKTISGAATNVAQPLEMWLGKIDEEDIPLIDNLIQPLREGLVANAETTISKAGTLKTTYNTKMAEPLNLAIENDRVIRESIAAYRELHQI